MKDEIRLLTSKGKGLAHQPTEVSIDWEGMDQEHLMVLARHAVIHALQCSWKRSPEAIPEKVCVNAIDFVRGQLHEVLEDRPSLPKARVSWMDSLLADLDPSERERLLRELEESP